jgi:hypothetical protein
MTKKEFKELKVGDEVSAFVFDKKRTAVIESIAKDTGRCIARILNPMGLKSFDYIGTILRFEPATKIAIIEADYSKLEIAEEEKQ